MSLFYQPHQIEKQRRQYVCTVCKGTWSRQSDIRQDCPVPGHPPIYNKWRSVPPHLQSRFKLRRHGLQPGGPPRAGFAYPRSPLFVYELYDVNEAIPRRPLSLKQLIYFNHPSVREYWICYDCRSVFKYADEQPMGRLCKTCHAKRLPDQRTKAWDG